jgi:hypothetical protein
MSYGVEFMAAAVDRRRAGISRYFKYSQNYINVRDSATQVILGFAQHDDRARSCMGTWMSLVILGIGVVRY